MWGTRVQHSDSEQAAPEVQSQQGRQELQRGRDGGGTVRTDPVGAAQRKGQRELKSGDGGTRVTTDWEKMRGAHPHPRDERVAAEPVNRPVVWR